MGDLLGSPRVAPLFLFCFRFFITFSSSFAASTLLTRKITLIETPKPRIRRIFLENRSKSRNKRLFFDDGDKKLYCAIILCAPVLVRAVEFLLISGYLKP